MDGAGWRPHWPDRPGPGRPTPRGVGGFSYVVVKVLAGFGGCRRPEEYYS